CWVLEQGRYEIYLGNNVRDAKLSDTFIIKETVVLEQLEEAMAPVRTFERMAGMQDGDGEQSAEGMRWANVPVRTVDMEQRCREGLPEEIPFTGDQGYRLQDVKSGKITMDQFIGQLSDEDLTCIVRGEGMGSPRVTPGTAAAFGGVSDMLAHYGIPCACCDDGPSGMRLDCGDKAFSLPGGTLLSCTFNRELVEELYTFLGIEMVKNKVDCLLGPGMNIHRHPLNGRNFEYFSEDPYLTGEMAVAQLKGLSKSGVTGTVKHFCANNQEKARHDLDSVVSERALREIYLKGYERAVKSGVVTSVMTTYGKVNGTHTASLYDLTTTILRKEWGFQGIVMTDWWADMNDPVHPESSKTNFAAMVRAQNDLYMVCPEGSENLHGDNTKEALENGALTRSQLQKCGKNICEFLMNTRAFERLLGENTEVELLHCPALDRMDLVTEVSYQKVGKELVLPLNEVNTAGGSEYSFGLDMEQMGGFIFEFTAKSDLGELAQLPVGFFFTTVPQCVLTWNGTRGEWVTKRIKFVATTRYAVFKLRFGQSGLTMRDIKITFDRPLAQIDDWDAYGRS
ncbi:MAG: glycoside hydrolase family 3 N-terminal domain-containing protein, partial [Lachnospiraceae bacterium]|nr:glycoside hydrolase family 3 N-terminal domain-containing protein [Lachnospiraceae bacterium]